MPTGGKVRRDVGEGADTRGGKLCVCIWSVICGSRCCCDVGEQVGRTTKDVVARDDGDEE